MLLMLLSAMNMVSCTGSASKTNDGMEQRKVLVTYFSRTGENYGVGNIEKGNTCIVAEMIAAATGGTLFEIEPVKAYPMGYDDCVEIAKKEQEAGARPAIKRDIAVEDYDVIFIGYPNWWGDMPMAVYTFIEKHNWQGKTVVPFCTHEGSGLSATERYIATACKGVTVAKGLAVKGSTAQNKRNQAADDVKQWLDKIAVAAGVAQK